MQHPTHARLPGDAGEIAHPSGKLIETKGSRRLGKVNEKISTGHEADDARRISEITEIHIDSVTGRVTRSRKHSNPGACGQNQRHKM